MLRVALALVAARLVSPALLFVDEASPNAGYGLTQFMSPAVPWRPLARKKFYMGNGNQNNFKFVNERLVDSYFHVLRESPRASVTAPVTRTENPAHLQQNETAHSPLPTPRSNNLHHNENPPPAANVPTHDDLRKLRTANRDYFRWQHVYEKQSVGRARKPVVEANFHRSDRRQPRAQSFQRAEPVKDKILHKAGVNELAHAPGMKEYYKRATIDKGGSRHQQSRDIRDGGSDFSKSVKHRPSYAAFYGMNPDPEAPSQLTGAGAGVGEGAGYYRGNVTNFVDILTGRKGVKTIGARAMDDSLQSLLF